MNAEDKAIPPAIFVCPMCGSDRWIGLGRPAMGQQIIPTPVFLPEIDKDGLPSKNVGYAVLGVACTVCDFVRLSSVDALNV